MSVEIKRIDDDNIIVNGKEVYKDSDGAWLSKVDLTTAETFAFQNFLSAKDDFGLDINRIFKQISIERDRQDAKFGKQSHDPVEWLMILGEEVGEVNKAALETYFGYEKADSDYSEYRKELIQVAAVAVAMIQDLDRKANR